MTHAAFVAMPAEYNAIAELMAQAPANPFATERFFEARAELGGQAWVLGLRDAAGRLACGCGAFLRRGRLERELEIPSLPAVANHGPFWTGLRTFCGQHGVTVLQLDSYGSPEGIEIPDLGSHCARRTRREFVLDLSGDPLRRYSANHRRNVHRAEQAGLVIRRTHTLQATHAHETLIGQSMTRRQDRGEDIPRSDSTREHEALLRTGAAELFQAMLGDAVLSSVLVVKSPAGGYYQSAGTSPEGMKMGASHFLIHSIGKLLQTDGARAFNLGGADAGTGLERFKTGFGTQQIALAAVRCYVGPAWRRRLGTALRLLRSDPRALSRAVTGEFSRMTVYAADTASLPEPLAQPDTVLRALTAADLQALAVEDPAFRTRQLERLGRFGASHAFGVFVEGQIAHISWLLPPAAIEIDTPRVLRPRPDEAEITCCETLPAYRGRGIYGFAISRLLPMARAAGVRRVFMKTAADNWASRKGIEKAGLQLAGSALLISLPVAKRVLVLRRFS